MINAQVYLVGLHSVRQSLERVKANDACATAPYVCFHHDRELQCPGCGNNLVDVINDHRLWVTHTQGGKQRQLARL